MRQLVTPLRLLLVLALLHSLLSVSDAKFYNIFWISGVNYTTWHSDKHFFVGDLFSFFYNKYQYSVLEVNKTSYENCVETDFLTNITRNGRDFFRLNEIRPYYFISGFGRCWGGVKLAINVEDIPPPPLPVSYSLIKNGSSVVKNSFQVLWFMVSLACSYLTLW